MAMAVHLDIYNECVNYVKIIIVSINHQKIVSNKSPLASSLLV